MSDHDKIAKRAHEKWEKAGKPAGDGKKFWYEAEQELTHSDVSLEEIEIDFSEV